MTDSTHSAISVADYILHKAAESNNTLTPMQVIKLVYMCHGWTLGLLGRPLIKEPVEAWKYGPVISDLYHAIKEYRSSPVCYPISNTAEDYTDDEMSIMNQVIDYYSGYSGLALSRLTHSEGTPWHKTWNRGGRIISNDLIEDHYKKLAE